MTYPPQQGGQPDPYGQQPGYGPPSQPGYGQPFTAPPTSPGPYGQPAYAGGPPPFGGMQPPQPAGERPTKLTVGAMAMLAIAVLSLIGSIVGLVASNQIIDNATQWCKDAGDAMGGGGSTADSCVSELEGGASNPLMNIGGFFWLVAFSLAAIFVLQGQNWARITGFVLNSFNLLCSGIAAIAVIAMVAIVDGVGDEVSSQSSGSGGNLPEFDVLPGWYMPVAVGVYVLTMVLSVVSIIMMANKESSQWIKAKSLGG